MTATAPPPVANRIASQFAPPLPRTPQGREAAWADALVAAMLFYQRQLASPVEAVAERAARAIFDLEKTRLRHGRDLAGAKPPPRQPLLAPLDPPVENVAAVEPPTKAADLVEDADDGEPLPAKTDEELVDEYERTQPEKFGMIVNAVRKRGAALGKPCDPDRVRAIARRHLVRELARARARHDRRRGGKEVRQTESFRVQSPSPPSSGG
jgi:hypothetical protein